jgi:putative ABC transport system permease protein
MLFQDLRYGARALRRAPSLTAISVLTIALGTGAGTAIFSVVKAVLLNPLRYPQADRLAWLDEVNEHGGKMQVGYPNFEDWRRQNRTFSSMAAFTQGPVNVAGGQTPVRTAGSEVTSGFFDVLGVRPSYGRLFLPAEEARGAAPAAVIGYGLWQRSYGGDPAIIGREIRILGRPATVVGVMPPGFSFPEKVEIWLPVLALDEPAGRTAHNFRVIGRLKPGVTLAQAQADVGAIARRLKQQYPGPFQGKDASVASLYAHIVGDVRPALVMLFGAVGFLLLIVCVNVANLLLVRVTARSRELAVRAAVGAGRGRLLRLMLGESLLLGLAGGACGLVTAAWSMDLLRAMLPANVPRAADIRIDGGVIAFALIVSAAAAILFGMLPAWRASRFDVIEALKAGSRSHTAGKRSRGIEAALVVSEVSLSLVLLAGAGLLLNSFSRLRSVDPGFRPGGVLEATLSFPDDSPRNLANLRAMLESVRAIPGIDTAGAIVFPPLDPMQPDGHFFAERRETLPANADAGYNGITPGYFRALHIPLLRGRDFTEADAGNSPGVVIVSRKMAEVYWPGRDPIGQRIWFDSFEPKEHWLTVVGVAEDVRQEGLTTPPFPLAYVALDQSRQSLPVDVTVMLRTRLDPAALAAAVRKRVQAIDKETTVTLIPMDAVMAQAVSRQRFQMQVLGGFALLALALAAMGLYGVLSYTVASSRPDIGIRMALGAQPREVFRMVVGRALALAAAGTALGVAGCFALRRVLASLLFGVGPGDPATLACAAAVLLSAALAASWFPARRAMAVDPVSALRDE